jgi:hypothetical protein
LFHDAAEGFLEAIDFLIELFTDFQLQLVVVLLFARGSFLLDLLDLLKKFLDHFFHAHDFWRAGNHIVLLVRVLEDALGAEHFLVVLAEKFDFFGGVRLAVGNLNFFGGVAAVHAACR